MKKHVALESIDLKKISAEFSLEYIDVRVEETNDSSINFKNGELLSCQEMPTAGAFLRVYHQGNWHESSTTKLTSLRQELEQLAKRATLATPGRGLKLKARAPVQTDCIAYSGIAATQVSLLEKLEFCKKMLGLPKQYKEIADWFLRYADSYKRKWFVASDGVSFCADYNQAGIRLDYSLKRGDKLFDDCARAWFMNHLHPHDRASATMKIFQEEIEESLKFLDAESVLPGKYPTLLAPEVTGVFTHESFGHKSEADFMLGDETMLKEWAMGKEVAAKGVSIVDEGDSFQTSGYCPYDDEGNKKEKTYLIRDGKLAGRLHNVTTSLALGEKNTGNGRAMNFEFGPIVRMTNTYIEPGTKSREEIIANIKQGIFIKDFKHGMGMSTFTIAPGKAYLIENGKITKPVRVSVISGSVFETLKNIIGIANDFEVCSSAFGGCGKFEQAPLPVADGGPSILVNDMQVS